MVCISGLYVDEILQAASAQDKANVQRKLQETFIATFSNRRNFTYTGMKIDTFSSQHRTMLQSEYIERLKFLDRNATFTEYRSLRARLIWVVNNRPDISAAVSIFSTVSQNSHKVKTKSIQIKL